MTAWFGSPLATARQGAVGEGWARSLVGLYLDAPLLATRVAGAALLELMARHPLLVVGWAGLVVGLIFVPWRARVNVILLLLTLGVPALFERQYPGVTAEEHPVAALGAFAAAGYVLLVALVARDRLRLLPVTFGAGALLIAVGVGVSFVTAGGIAARGAGGDEPCRVYRTHRAVRGGAVTARGARLGYARTASAARSGAKRCRAAPVIVVARAALANWLWRTGTGQRAAPGRRRRRAKPLAALWCAHRYGGHGSGLDAIERRQSHR